MKTFRSPEEAIVEWKFAREAARELALDALKSDIEAFAAKDEVDQIEEYLVRTCPNAEFDLGDGRMAIVGDAESKSRVSVTLPPA